MTKYSVSSVRRSTRQHLNALSLFLDQRFADRLYSFFCSQSINSFCAAEKGLPFCRLWYIAFIMPRDSDAPAIVSAGGSTAVLSAAVGYDRRRSSSPLALLTGVAAGSSLRRCRRPSSHCYPNNRRPSRCCRRMAHRSCNPVLRNNPRCNRTSRRCHPIHYLPRPELT